MEKKKQKILAIVLVASIVLVAGISTVQAWWSPDKAAGEICKATLEARGYECTFSPPWWWPLSDCSWYGLTCAQSAY